VSSKWKCDTRDCKSAFRHVVIPLVSGAAVAGLEAAQTGGFNLGQIKTAVFTSVIAGVLRLLHRVSADISQRPPKETL